MMLVGWRLSWYLSPPNDDTAGYHFMPKNRGDLGAYERKCSYEMENPKNRLNNWRNRCRWMDEQKERRGNSRGGAERRLNM